MWKWLFFGIIGFIVVANIIGHFIRKIRDAEMRLRQKIEKADQEIEQARTQNELDRKAIEILAGQKSQGFPWLAEAYADYFELQNLKTAKFLVNKPHPAYSAAEHVREIAKQRRAAEKAYRILKYQLEYYERLFPWLEEFKSEDIDDLLITILEDKEKQKVESRKSEDPAKKWLTQAEYQELSDTEKNQRALDRYWQKKKRKWEIGRDYERYIGYQYETSAYSVYYQGIVEGFADLGRDLIAKRDHETEIVQCKCWSQHKTIHEKHVFQLFGTTIEYWIKNKDIRKTVEPILFHELLKRDGIIPTFITSTTLSDKAKEFAQVLGVKVLENVQLAPYPSIKCNISRKTGEKIYHLPFDQQYDKTVIEEDRNECYVETVKEAEDLGFRRAFRWRGEHQEGSSQQTK